MTPELDLRLLAVLLAVQEQGSLSGAARHLGVTQPTVTRAVAALERGTGVRLLERDRRGSALTPAGVVLAARAVELLADARRALADTRAAGAAPVHLRVGVSAFPGGRLQQQVLDAAAAQPALEVVAVPSNGTRERVQALAAGDLDVAFVRLTAPPSARFTLLELARDPLLLAVPDGDELAAAPAVTPAALDGRPLAFYRRGQNPWWYDEVLGLLRDHGAVPRIALRALWAFEVTPQVAAGRALGLVSTGIAPQVWLPGVTYRRLAPVAPVVGLGLLTRRAAAADPLVARFLSAARAALPPASAVA